MAQFRLEWVPQPTTNRVLHRFDVTASVNRQKGPGRTSMIMTAHNKSTKEGSIVGHLSQLWCFTVVSAARFGCAQSYISGTIKNIGYFGLTKLAPLQNHNDNSCQRVKGIQYVARKDNRTEVPQCRPIEDFFGHLFTHVYKKKWIAKDTEATGK